MEKFIKVNGSMTSFIIPQFSVIIPELIILGMACFILLLDLFLPKSLRDVSYSLSQLTLVAAAVMSIIQLQWPTMLSFDNAFILDRLSIILKLFIYLLTFFAFIYARVYNKEHKMESSEYYVLGLFSVLGMMILVSAHNLITIYLGAELLALPLYAMAALRRISMSSAEGAMKFFVTGVMASALLLYGMSFLYGVTGDLDISAIAAALPHSVYHHAIILGMIFVITGILFKIGAFPFHMWIPDVYQSSAAPVTAMITSAPKVAGFAMAIRLLVDTMPSLSQDWQSLLIIAAFLSMCFGNLVAIAQTNIKRMFAYSSIAHMGYMSLGIIAATTTGYQAALFYVVVYAMMAVGGFGMIALLSRSGVETEEISDFRGLNSRNPWLAFIFLLLLFSMAGIPPTIGFFAKLSLIDALIRVHLEWLACFALIFAIIGAFYYIRVVKTMYFEKPSQLSAIHITKEANLALSINAVAVLILGIFPSFLFSFCYSAFKLF